MNLHRAPRVMLLALAAMAFAAAPAAAQTTTEDLPVLTDAMTAGVVRGSDGFGTNSVVVPSNGYVTYLVQGEPTLSGRQIEIWTRTRATDWVRVTSRTFGTDGTARYHARIAEWTAFQGRLPGDAVIAGPAAHGRIATVSADGSTRIVVDCAEVTTEDPGTVFVGRAVGASVGSLVRVTLCSNASTGFSWVPSVISSGQLAKAGHSSSAGGPTLGSPGTETWTFRVTARGTGYAVLEYSRPWTGGEKAIWLLLLRVN